MATISENLQILKNSITSIKQAIVNKCGNVEGNITTYADYINSINTNSGDNQSPTPVQISDVNFYDYDGTILYSYTKEQFLALSAMPELPTREGLICQGWNWTLDEAKEYVADYGKQNIGAMYITDDGDTRLYIRIAAEERMNVPLYWNQTVTNGVSIDWGDGSAIESFSGTGNKNTTHTYAKTGDYVIKLKVADGCKLGLGNGAISNCIMGPTGNSDKIYCNMLQKAEIGSGVVSIGIGAFYGCSSLISVNIPSNITSIGARAFYNCFSIKFITIPSGVTSITEYMLANCYSIESISIPSRVTSISLCAFYVCNSLRSVTMPSGLISIGNQVFYNCYSLSTAVIPNRVTNIGVNTFYNCQSLMSVALPNSITRLSTSTFYNCYSLSAVIIPSGVTNIESSAFNNCYGMKIYDFTSHTSVPTLADTSVFSGIPSDCVIKVPESLLEEWKAATNWSTYADYIVAG